jgi:Siphovirus ReqiPepy6 Gp37-like protein
MAFEWYILDENFARSQVLEGFYSFIWTERYSGYGDFQIVMESTLANRRMFQDDTWIGMNKSRYIMEVDTVLDEVKDDGSRDLTVTGRSMEALLLDRVAMPSISDTTSVPNWVVTGTPGDIIRYMFDQICNVCVLSEYDTVPLYHTGTLLPAGNIDEPADEITVTAPPNTLYDTAKQIADTYTLGFRLIKNGDLGEVYFEVYTGDDRTTTQTILDPVVFDPSLDNVSSVKQLSSTALVKTVAYVYAQNGSAVVYAPGVDETAAGDGRKVLLVNSSNTGEAGSELDTALTQEGLIALRNQRIVYSFDCEVPQDGEYIYGVDYNLGDLVEERNSDGFGNKMLVTEQIFSSDDTGERSYPTLTLSQVIVPGTWDAWDASQHWADVSDTDYWGTI